ncbi:MAG: S8 family peptidase, partial [Candidatus Freyarchaeota archaeon]
MFVDRLTSLAQKRAHSRLISPVIVKARRGYLAEVVEYAKQFEISHKVLERGLGLLEAVTPEFLSFGAFPLRIFRNFNMFSAILPREGIFDLAEQRFVEKIYPDEQVWAFQYPTVPSEGVYSIRYFKKLKQFTSTWWTKKLIGADVANQKGFLGQGILVSIVDTGSPHFHEQTARCRFRTVIPFQRTDENGHGTWCVSCVGGSLARDDVISRAIGMDVYCEGMAPSCDLLAVKCLGLVVGTGTTSWILHAIDISLDEGAKVISMSLGGDITAEKPEDSPYYAAFETCRERGCIPVVAAGNSGSEGA